MDYANIDSPKVKEITEKLDELLASYQVYCQKLKAFHWNIKGKSFFELHAKFEELYQDAIIKIDELAERILILGYCPSQTFKEYLQKSALIEVDEIPAERKMINELLLDMNQLLKMEKECIKLATKHCDDGTVEMLRRYIAFKEKVCWMFITWLKVDLTKK